jgi:hypothetical protein
MVPGLPNSSMFPKILIPFHLTLIWPEVAIDTSKSPSRNSLAGLRISDLVKFNQPSKLGLWGSGLSSTTEKYEIRGMFAWK